MLEVECRGNYSATSNKGNNMKLVHWPLMGGLLHLVMWYSNKGPSSLHQMVRCSAVLECP